MRNKIGRVTAFLAAAAIVVGLGVGAVEANAAAPAQYSASGQYTIAPDGSTSGEGPNPVVPHIAADTPDGSTSGEGPNPVPSPGATNGVTTDGGSGFGEGPNK